MASVIRGTVKTGLKTEELRRSLPAARPPRDSRDVAKSSGWRGLRAAAAGTTLFRGVDKQRRARPGRARPSTICVRHAIPELALPVRNGVPRHLIANGLVGEPTAPVIGMAGATNMNSYTLSAAQSSARSFR